MSDYAAPAVPPQPPPVRPLAGGGGETNMAMRSLIGQKEAELQAMHEYRLKALEAAISERDKQLAELQDSFKKLKLDFQYNLQLFEERDAELERYDVAFANLKNVVRDRDAEISDLKVSADEMEAQLKAEQARGVEVERYCQDKLKDANERLEGLRHAKDEELAKVRAELAEVRRQFSAELHAKDEMLDTQRRDMAASFD
eukprot:1528858-Rhodomonas_salina.1